MDDPIARTFRGLTIEDRSLSETAAAIIRHKIIFGELEPGLKLCETDFAEALGISRACIRAAFQTLCGEGLLKKATNRFTQVIRLTRDDVEEICALRAAIEACCLETAIAKQKIDWGALALRAEATRVQDGRDLKWIEPDFAFHLVIVESSGNTRAIAAWRQLRNQAMLALNRAARTSAQPIELDSHDALVSDLQTLPVREAAERLRRHVLNGFSDIVLKGEE